MYTPDQPLNNPEWEMEDAYNAAWREAGHTDDLYEHSLTWKIENLLETTLWDEDTKQSFALDLPLWMTNGEMQDLIDYLYEHQPRVPFSQVKNPSQKQISAFIRKVCNL
jgi:hypothetical protein